MRERTGPARKLTGEYKFAWAAAASGLLIVSALYTFSHTAGTDAGRDAVARAVGTRDAGAGATPPGAGDLGKVAAAMTTARGGQRTALYRGVSFVYPTSLASVVEAETKPAYALESETDTGDEVAPEHVVFKFSGAYAAQHQASFFSPQLAVYPTADFKKVFAKSQSYARQVEEEIRALKAMLYEQPTTWERGIPLIPVKGASQALHARVKYVTFGNGRGVMFLTQYNVEPSLINNEGLTYAFQGMTDDGDYYVLATFPVNAPSLPDGYDAEGAGGYTLVPPRSYRGEEYQSFRKGYQDYLARVAAELESLPPHSYRPNLEIIEDMIRSLSVKKD